MKAAIYTRVSTDEQAETGTSLDTQREQARAYVTSRGWDLVQEYSDAGISGAKDETKRPALNRMMKAARGREVDVIVVVKLDRFSRSMKQFVNAVSELDELGVSFVSVTEGFDSTTLTGQLLRNILASFADFERGRIAERSMAGRIARAREGYWVGGDPPFGHRVEDRRLVLEEDEAATLKRAAELILRTGTTLMEAAHTLNEEQRLPRQWHPRSGEKKRGERMRTVKWDSESLRHILANESLTGLFTYGKTSKTGAIQYEVPEIFDQATFSLLQEHLRVTSRTPSREYKTYPLSQGRLVSPCGQHCTGMWVSRKGHRYYRCRGKEGPQAERCSCPYYFRADELEERVYWAVVPLLEDRERLLALTGLDREDDTQVVEDQVKSLDAKIALLDEALTQRVAEALSAGMSGDRIAKATKRLETDLEALQERRSEAASVEAVVEERKVRRARLSLLTRASVKLLNSRNDLEFQKQLFGLLDLRASLTSDGKVTIKGMLREDLPFALSVHSPEDCDDTQTVDLFAHPFELAA